MILAKYRSSLDIIEQVYEIISVHENNLSLETRQTELNDFYSSFQFLEKKRRMLTWESF